MNNRILEINKTTGFKLFNSDSQNNYHNHSFIVMYITKVISVIES